MPYLENLISDIEKTHKNLGNLIALLQISVKARKFVLVIGSEGCGKSRAMDYVCQNTADSWQPTKVSIDSLATKVEKLTSFRSVIGIDDISAISTPYARTTTISTLSALCYTHRVEPSMVGADFCIEDFYGSALMGIQPKLLKDIILYPEWGSHIRDKALRYYHLYRPIESNFDMPIAQIEKGIDIDTVKFKPDKTFSKWIKLESLARLQWSKSRAEEHLIGLLKGIASLENRNVVLENDFDLLYSLLKPMAIERIVVDKKDLQADRVLDADLLDLLTEYYTYNGKFSLAHISQDFDVKPAYTYRIMQNQNGYWQKIHDRPTIFTASELLKKLLSQYNLEIKENED